jgi:RIO kinase 1
VETETETLTALPGPLEEFYEFGLITDELDVIKSGKEATAYLVRGTKKLGAPYAVAKVYHDRSHRNFKSASVYQEGRVILKGQVERAVANHSEFGKQAEDALWVDHEFEWLSNLNYAGVDCPEPYYSNARAILMELVSGDEPGSAAPQLQHAPVDPGQAPAMFERMLWNIETMLSQNCVHGDLSPFNILVRDGRCVIIDLPQCIDPRFSQSAYEMLERDITNVSKYFGKHGVEFDPARYTRQLWNRWRFGDL